MEARTPAFRTPGTPSAEHTPRAAPSSPERVTLDSGFRAPGSRSPKPSFSRSCPSRPRPLLRASLAGGKLIFNIVKLIKGLEAGGGGGKGRGVIKDLGVVAARRLPQPQAAFCEAQAGWHRAEPRWPAMLGVPARAPGLSAGTRSGAVAGHLGAPGAVRSAYRGAVPRRKKCLPRPRQPRLEGPPSTNSMGYPVPIRTNPLSPSPTSSGPPLGSKESDPPAFQSTRGSGGG